MIENVNPMKHIYALSVDIGPRRPSSENEEKAADYIFNFFRSLGLEPVKQKFYTLSTFSWVYIVLFGLYILSFILYFYNIILSIPPAILALIIFLLEGSTKPVLYYILLKGLSYNVFTIIKPKNKVKYRLILTGHYDSSRPAWFFNPKFVKNFRKLFLAIALSSILYPLILIITLLYETFISTNILFINIRDLALILSLVPIGFIFLGFFSMIHREAIYKDIPGANDNASGASMVLALAEILSKNPLESTEVWCVATGSEESGMFGMIHFLKEYGKNFDKNKTFILNFDMVGSGDIYYITGEGLLTTMKSDKLLIEIADKVAKSHEEWNIRSRTYKLLPTDATPAIARGFKAMSIMGFNEKGLLPNWHWYTDTYENIEEQTIKKALKYSYEIIKEIDKLAV